MPPQGEWHVNPLRDGTWTAYPWDYTAGNFVKFPTEDVLRRWIADLPRGEYANVDWGRGYRRGTVPPGAAPGSPGQGERLTATGPLPCYGNGAHVPKQRGTRSSRTPANAGGDASQPAPPVEFAAGDQRPPDVSQALDCDLVAMYMHGFYGYGSYHAPFWFIGVEEGGDDLREKMAAWQELGSQELVDLASFAQATRAPQVKRWFTSHPPIQRTWGPLIRLLLASKGLTATRDNVRYYQRDQLGRLNGETRMVELMPLPSPSSGTWLYADRCRLPLLQNRKTYMENVGPARAQHLKRRILEHQPPAVICYGGRCKWRQLWEMVAGRKFTLTNIPEVEWAMVGTTTILLIRHPSRSSNQTFEEAGRWLRRRLDAE